MVLATRACSDVSSDTVQRWDPAARGNTRIHTYRHHEDYNKNKGIVDGWNATQVQCSMRCCPPLVRHSRRRLTSTCGPIATPGQVRLTPAPNSHLVAQHIWVSGKLPKQSRRGWAGGSPALWHRGRWLFGHLVALALKLRVLLKERSGFSATATEKDPVASRKRLAAALMEPWVAQRRKEGRRGSSACAVLPPDVLKRIARFASAKRLEGCVGHNTFQVPAQERRRCTQCMIEDPKSDKKGALPRCWRRTCTHGTRSSPVDCACTHS